MILKSKAMVANSLRQRSLLEGKWGGRGEVWMAYPSPGNGFFPHLGVGHLCLSLLLYFINCCEGMIQGHENVARTQTHCWVPRA